MLIDRLARDGDKAQVSCDACDQHFPLHDELERLLADPELSRQTAALETEAPQLKAGLVHLRRCNDGREIFSSKKPCWIHT